ncbi:MAG: hypothetical protein QF377_02585 [Candidatus Thalassarchaeum sp.]|jgi:hypothetical protein|nr:hypothetical protein [Candidatus Thalassarchaeum sp.]MDP7004203.1 hypothetical protein [Candidatus Thalassarchaeaceae archaeon]
MGKGQASFSKSSKALLSKIGGGCGSIIPYRKEHYELAAEAGPIWCGMESREKPGLYLICEECQNTLD